MSGYEDCKCCGEVMVDDDRCPSCIAAGCDPAANDCQVPQCFECGVFASWMMDMRWHANCDEMVCTNEVDYWDDKEAKETYLKYRRNF